MIAGIVRGWVHGEAPRGAMLDALVDRQDDEPSAAGQRAGIQQAREIGQRAGVVAAIPGQNFFYAFAHGRPPRKLSIPRTGASLPTLLDELGDQPRPALMTGADTGALVAVEVLVKQQQIAPVRIGLKPLGGPMHRPRAVTAAQEQPHETAGELGGDIPEVQQAMRAARTLDFEVVAVEVVELLQR